jgi:DtxR family Mn-dependent transcriptional regulator
MPSSPTVENYLKAIYQAQLRLERRGDLVPMGQLASALGVVPGTATTMVKALAESGLVKYEPYGGVRLTQAGEKLAALVVRRHRLIELFLVKVMGMSWTDVHEEAEHLEHAVSDRLIERMDEMLGRPAVDPHGDPIPDPEGVLERRAMDTLLTCQLNVPLTVARVTDQDPEFLRFVERRELKPGAVVEVEERDSAADSVRLRGRDGRQITIGTGAASKVLVNASPVSPSGARGGAATSAASTR